MLIRGFGVVVADVGHFQATGLSMDCIGNAAVDTLESIDSHFIPALRQHIHAVTLEPPTVCGNELWPYTCGISLPLVHSAGAPTTIRATGHVIRHSAASRDAILEALDTRFLPLVRRQLRAAVLKIPFQRNLLP